MILDIFNADNVLIDTKVGFAQAFRQLNTAEIGHNDLTEKEWDRLSFIDQLGAKLSLFLCCAQYQNETDLTKTQIQFFQNFAQSAELGSIDLLSVAAIIDEMTQEDFLSSGVRETALIYLTYEIIRYHYYR